MQDPSTKEGASAE
jgi:hypothetical protein